MESESTYPVRYLHMLHVLCVHCVNEKYDYIQGRSYIVKRGLKCPQLKFHSFSITEKLNCIIIEGSHIILLG